MFSSATSPSMQIRLDGESEGINGRVNERDPGRERPGRPCLLLRDSPNRRIHLKVQWFYSHFVFGLFQMSKNTHT